MTLRQLLDDAALRGARAHAGDIMLSRLVEAVETTLSAVPICRHQDHGNDDATCLSAIQHGFTSVMMDGSLEADAKTPATWDGKLGIANGLTETADKSWSRSRASLALSAVWKKDGHGADGKLSYDQMVTDLADLCLEPL